MRKRGSQRKGRPNKCIFVTVGGVRRRVCFDSNGRVKSNRRHEGAVGKSKGKYRRTRKK